MIPRFVEPNKRRKEINLGGVHSASTHSDILAQAKARRLQRQDQKQQLDNAIKIQAWWRGVACRRETREELRRLFADNVTGIVGLRCLVIIGQDEGILAQWSSAVTSTAPDILLNSDPSWHVLFRRTSLLLLQSVSNDPQSQHAVIHLTVLNTLLSSNPNRTQLLEHLLSSGYYTHLRRALLSIPIESKAAPSLPLLTSLLVLPFSIPELLQRSLVETFAEILSIPLLPNRLPLTSLSTFSARLPLSSFNLLTPYVPDLLNRPTFTQADRVHTLANLSLFTPTRYSKLSVDAFDAYLDFMAALMNSLPVHALEPPADQETPKTWADEDDSDDETETRVDVVESFQPKPKLPPVDERTRKRLQTLPSIQHMNALLNATQNHRSRRSLVSYCLALSTIWPTRRDKVLNTIAFFNGGGLVREIYRSYVRSSVIGRDDDISSVAVWSDPAQAASWPPLLLLADLYTQVLLTMGDDEFFSNGSTASAARNPLTLDEITAFSRQLLNVAFILYWREDPLNVQEGGIPGLGNVKWELVREKVTKCLQAIHARDSRRPFTPKDHWLVTSQVDMATFIDAAVTEERALAEGLRPLTKRQIAFISPRLGVLHNIPFAIPFEGRVSIFRNFIANDRRSRGIDAFVRRPQNWITVRRGSIAQDGFDKLQEVDLRSPISITFIDQFGQEEAGIDGGGVFKEFLTSLCKEVFDTDRGLWLATKKNELYPNPHSYATEAHSLNWYRFIGRILGKALYEGILVDIAFAGFFLAKWLGKQSLLDDLASLDPTLYQGLIFLKNYTGDPEELSLNFTVAEEEFGVAKTIDLIPNGSNIPVTRDNRLQYIYLVSHYRLTKQIKAQSVAFFEGLSEMIDPRWLHMFNQQELQVLLGGVNSPVDVEDLRAHTHYGGLYDDNEPTIQMFWKVVRELDQDGRRKLLRFATSCSRPPLLGFKELVPNFSIRDAGSDEHRLPTASTCVNLLKLPRYQSEKTLREKLIQAINSNAGFDLS